MANIIGLITVNGKEVIEVDAPPADGAGTPANIGSIAMYDSGSLGSAYLKTGAADTAWSRIDVSDQDWSLDGNALTGATPDAPDQQFGSTNDYDVVHIRNNTELMRLVQQGLLIGLSANAGGRLQVEASALGEQIFRQQSPSGDATANVIKVSVQRKVQTTDNVLTTLADIAVPTNSVMLFELDVVARQHSGSAGNVGDGAAFVREVHARNNAGTVTIRREQNSFTSRDRAGWDLQSSISGTNVRYQVRGETDRNIAWYAHYEFMLAID